MFVNYFNSSFSSLYVDQSFIVTFASPLGNQLKIEVVLKPWKVKADGTTIYVDTWRVRDKSGQECVTIADACDDIEALRKSDDYIILAAHFPGIAVLK